jgi:hypothetical protein
MDYQNWWSGVMPESVGNIFCISVLLVLSISTSVQAAAPAGSSSESTGAAQTEIISGLISGWPGGSGTLVSDDGDQLGSVAADGTFTLSLSGKPGAQLRPLESIFRCDGVALTNGESGYYTIGRFLGIVDASGRRIGRIQAASSAAVADWVINPMQNSAVPGYGLQFSYVSAPASSQGDCNTGSESQRRSLNWAAGWNIERITVIAVSKSPFFPTDAPAEIEWVTVATVPADVVWYFDGFGAAAATAVPAADVERFETGE